MTNLPEALLTVFLRSRTLLVCGLIALSGCSGETQPPMVPVNGKVTMDGKAITGGAVYLHPDASNSFQDDKPSGQLQLDGSFTIRTFPFGDGVPPGRYKVTLVPELASRIGHPEYGQLESTPWQISVPEGGLTDQKFEVQ